MAARLTERFGQPVVIDNRAGASGAIAMELTARAAPDGYTMILTQSTSAVIAPAINDKLPYDTLRDPKSTREQVNRLHAVFVGVLKSPDIQERLLADGAVPVGNTPDEFRARIRSDLERFARIAREAGIKAE